MTANTFGIHVCTVSKTIHNVCRVICYKLGSKLIKLPQSQGEMQEKVAEFEAKYAAFRLLVVRTALTSLLKGQQKILRIILAIKVFSL